MKQTERIEDLEARIAALEAQLNPKPQPQPEPIRVTSEERDGQGQVKRDPNLPSYEERMAQRREQEEAEAKAEKEHRTAGLPSGHWKDISGLVRDADGNRVIDSPETREARRKVLGRLAADNLARLERDNISTYHGEEEDQD